ncbi:MAG: 5-methylcytosine-specific restriction endonuclease system specificity protein McrC [Saprospiraceae bacterium]|nr:5-methylcytosine-specific restriction endonuclease system specificity protein McrC [Saprospiraceae bacterium]
MKIPVANIYYLLSYAWDKLEEGRLAQVNADACATPLDLLANLLLGGTSYLFKKGIDRNYREQQAGIPAIKGKLQIGESLQQLALQQGKAVCCYDVFDHDVLHNQILKTTLNRLCRTEALDRTTKATARSLALRFHEVSQVPLTKAVFRQVQLHRNNRFYGFLMAVCELLFDNLLPDERAGYYRFRDFLRDDEQMGRLFEAFVRNFYKRELPGSFQVSREDIRWQSAATDTAALALLPKMQTDVTIRSAGRKIILDTKYYKDVLTRHFGIEKLRRDHLSQLFSYLKHQVNPRDAGSIRAEGILLYATAGQEISVDYPDMIGHQLSIRTVNLNDDWRNIRACLLKTLERSPTNDIIPWRM